MRQWTQYRRNGSCANKNDQEQACGQQVWNSWQQRSKEPPGRRCGQVQKAEGKTSSKPGAMSQNADSCSSTPRETLLSTVSNRSSKRFNASFPNAICRSRLARGSSTTTKLLLEQSGQVMAAEMLPEAGAVGRQMSETGRPGQSLRSRKMRGGCSKMRRKPGRARRGGVRMLGRGGSRTQSPPAARPAPRDRTRPAARLRRAPGRGCSNRFPATARAVGRHRDRAAPTRRTATPRRRCARSEDIARAGAACAGCIAGAFFRLIAVVLAFHGLTPICV